MSDETKICDKCYDIQSPYIDFEKSRNCEHCGNNYFFKVDELIAPAISIFNKKGYKTQFCCSGHITLDDENSYNMNLGTYIVFYDQHKFNSIPLEFKCEPFMLESGLRYIMGLVNPDKYIKITYGESLSLLFNAVKSLQLWADSLPNVSKSLESDLTTSGVMLV